MGGGIIYDAVIARTAFDAGASVLLTWNTRDFLRVAPPGLEIRQP
jgi:predicted nucleic acid-binding protein